MVMRHFTIGEAGILACRGSLKGKSGRHGCLPHYKMVLEETNVKRLLTYAAVIAAVATLAAAQSPADQVSVTVNGKTITIKYSAPSVKGRQIFGDGGLISGDPNYPVWRAGANAATALHTDADLDIAGLKVPAGDYTLFALVKDPNAWELIVSKDTKEWGLAYNASKDLGRVKMTMSTPAAPVERLKYNLDQTGGKVKLTLTWEKHVASVMIGVH
jgi:hypothetical protein